MFGEKDMYGTYTIKVDKGNRICIPAKTKAEPGEEFVLSESKLIEGGIDIRSIENFSKVYMNFLDAEMKADNEEQIKKIRKEKVELLRSVRKVVAADENRRIVVSGIFESGNIDFLCSKDYAILTKSKVKK